MAATSLLALIDDIATVLDDVAVLTKVVGKKTAGVLGDDLALNAEQVTGVRPDRELPVVWAVAKGSAVNKLILVPAALAIGALAPWAITPLLMFGGLFLCYEGFEKVAHKLLHDDDKEHKKKLLEAVADPNVDVVALEKKKIKGAIRTDFILSAEIVAIALGSVASESFYVQAAVLATIAAVFTAGVYGLVAGIVKLDDLGLYLQRSGNSAGAAVGRGILRTAPLLMKLLSVAGTAAMFLVGGGILVHGLGPVERWIGGLAERAATAGPAGGVLAALVPSLGNLVVGMVAGGIAVLVMTTVARLRRS